MQIMPTLINTFSLRYQIVDLAFQYVNLPVSRTKTKAFSAYAQFTTFCFFQRTHAQTHAPARTHTYTRKLIHMFFFLLHTSPE